MAASSWRKAPAAVPRSMTQRPAPSAPPARRPASAASRSPSPTAEWSWWDRPGCTAGARWKPGTLSENGLVDQSAGAVDRRGVADDGRVLLIGMCSGRETGWTGLFDPTATVVSPRPPTTSCRPTPIRLADGRVLIVGGDIGELDAASVVEVFRCRSSGVPPSRRSSSSPPPARSRRARRCAAADGDAAAERG